MDQLHAHALQKREDGDTKNKVFMPSYNVTVF